MSSRRRLRSSSESDPNLSLIAGEKDLSVGCACCFELDSCQVACGSDLGCVELDIVLAAGEGQNPVQEQDVQNEDSNWWLRGGQELLHQELWGKVNREHTLRSHIPFNASCEYCVRGRGLEPARREEREMASALSVKCKWTSFSIKVFSFLHLCWLVVLPLGQ